MAWAERHQAKPKPQAEPEPLKQGEIVLAEHGGNTLVGIKASAIEAEALEWLWEGKLPKGVLAINAGQAGQRQERGRHRLGRDRDHGTRLA